MQEEYYIYLCVHIVCTAAYDVKVVVVTVTSFCDRDFLQMKKTSTDCKVYVFTCIDNYKHNNHQNTELRC